MKCVLKINAQELSFLCLVLLSFLLKMVRAEIINCKVSPRVFFPGFPCPGTKVGLLFPNMQAGGSLKVGAAAVPAKGGAGARLLQAGPSSAIDGQPCCQPAACFCECTLAGFHRCVLGLASSQWCWLVWGVGAGRTLWIVPSLPWLGLEQKTWTHILRKSKHI